ncbi:SDR family NAD(P)-dependent oxidoreductase [Myxococcaceae bacterium GXIMD 01537]
MDIGGKRVLITGGTGGIGGALARAMREKGARVAVTGRDAGRLRRLADDGFEVFEAALDAPGGPERLVERVLSAGPVDILVNNAAVQALMDFRAEDVAGQLASIDRELELNLRAPLRLTRLLLPSLLQRPSAAVVNVTSGLALVPKQSSPVYCATKAALRSFSTSLRWQLEGTRVQVFEALPPLVDTEMTRGRGTRKLSPERCAAELLDGLLKDRHPLYIGKTGLLALLARWTPGVAERIMRGL